MTPKKPLVPMEPITARVSSEAARRLRVTAALENCSTGQVLDRLILQTLPDLQEIVSAVPPLETETPAEAKIQHPRLPAIPKNTE